MAKLIAIKGFRMPETCISCPMQFGGWCGASPPEIDERVAETVDEAFKQKRPDWCPLCEVKAEPVQYSPLIKSGNDFVCGKCATVHRGCREDIRYCKHCGCKFNLGTKIFPDDYIGDDDGSGCGQTFSPD